MEKDLRNQEKELSDDIVNLNKKSKYLEKQYQEASAQLRDIVSIDSSSRFCLAEQLAHLMLSISSIVLNLNHELSTVASPLQCVTLVKGSKPQISLSPSRVHILIFYSRGPSLNTIYPLPAHGS
jgi:hypothetical protein